MFTPVLNIGEQWRAPSHPGYQFDATGEQMLKASQSPPGVVDGLTLNPLSKETLFIDDPLAGQIPFRAREIAPEYRAFWLPSSNAGARKWILLPSESEAKQREISRQGLQKQFDDLLAKAKITEPYFYGLVAECNAIRNTGNDAGADALWAQVLSNLSKEERERVHGYSLLLNQLRRESGVSFLEEVPDLFGSGVTGIRWNLAVPNIDVMLASSWTCEADQKQSFRIQRLNVVPGQIRSQFEIRIGNGKTLYALAFTEGEGIEFRHYRPLAGDYTLERRIGDETEWQSLQLRATGELMPEEKLQIEKWKEQSAAIKKRFRNGSKPTGEAAEKIEQLKQQIADLKKSKHLTDFDRTRYDALEKRIFIAREKITLQEDTRSLFDKEVDITLGFHRKGYVSIRIGTGAKPGAEPFYYVVKSIAESGKPGTLLPAGSRILLKSNGGVWGAIHGVTDAPARAKLYSPTLAIPFPFDPAEWSVTLDAIGQDPDEADPKQPLTVLPRCRVKGRVEEVSPQTQYARHTGPARIRVCLDFFCEPNQFGARDYGSELYRATVTCKAGDLPPMVFDRWTARANGFPIEDVSFQADVERGTLHQLQIIDDETRPANFPTDLAERAVEFGLIDNRPGAGLGQYIPLMRGGSIGEPKAEDIRRLGGATLRVWPRRGSRRSMMIKSVETLFDVPVMIPLLGNDRYPGDYLWELFQMHGAPAELLAGLPQTREEHVALGLSKLPTGRVGTYPTIKPNRGDSCWAYALEIVQKHCFGFRLRRDAVRGIALERDVFRATGLEYSTALRASHPMSVQRPLSLWQDVSEYVTDCTFTGAQNPARGRRYAGRETIHEATKPGSAYYVGRHRPYFASPDDALESDVKCLLAARQFLMLRGLPPWFASWVSWFEPELREGDVLKLDGVRFVVQGLDVARFAKAKEQKFTVTARLMDDVPIWQSG